MTTRRTRSIPLVLLVAWSGAVVPVALAGSGASADPAIETSGAGGARSLVPTRGPWKAEGDQVSANFGISVGTAGDVNGDGYADAIVGAYAYDNGQINEGRAFVYHGSVAGLSTTPDWTAESDQTSAYLGFSVATAGDVNGDGYADVIVGAYRYDNGQINEGRAFVYHGSADGLSATPDWRAESDKRYGYFGVSVGRPGT